ncbi:MAG: peptidoglycan recognition protein family protein [Culicoidibacterales bacterium]
MAGNNIDTLALGRKGVVIHNDAGYGDAKSYEWMKNDYNRLSQGFAHTYIDEHNRVYIRPDNQTAWHTATFEGNEYYVGVEVCQSMGDEAQFLRNEQATFKYVAEYMKANGMTPNRNTVRLHKEFSSTACPHRSWDLHGKDTNAVKDYFISQIQKYMDGGTGESTPSTPQATVHEEYAPKNYNYGFDCPQVGGMSAWHDAYVEDGMAFYPYNGLYFSNANRDDMNDVGKPCKYFTFEDGKYVMDWKGQRAMSDGHDVVITHVDGVEQGYWAKY